MGDTLTDSDRLLLQGVQLFGVRYTVRDIETHEGSQAAVRAAMRLRALTFRAEAWQEYPAACRYIRSIMGRHARLDTHKEA